MSRARVVVILSFVHTSGAAREARADDSMTTAETLFQQSRALVDAGRYAEACPKARGELQAGARGRDAVQSRGLLRARWANGRARTPRSSGREHRARGPASSNASGARRSAPARSSLALAKLRFLVSAPAPGLEVRVDDAIVEKTTWSEALPVDPGAHRVRASAPGRTAFELAIDVEGGARHRGHHPGARRRRTSRPVVAPPPAPAATSCHAKTICAHRGRRRRRRSRGRRGSRARWRSRSARSAEMRLPFGRLSLPLSDRGRRLGVELGEHARQRVDGGLHRGRRRRRRSRGALVHRTVRAHARLCNRPAACAFEWSF